MRATSRTAVMILALALLPARLPAAGETSKCAGAKMAATGTCTLRAAKCHAKAIRKGVAPSSACLGTAAAKLTSAFTRAEQRKTDCLTLDDAATIDATAAGFVAGLVSALPYEAGAASRRCSATKLVATGARSAKMLRCYAKSMRRGEPPATACLAKTAAAFERAFARAERHGGCAATGDAAIFATSADGFAGVVGQALGLPADLTTTTTTTTSSSTSTTSTTGTTLPGQTTSTSLVATTTSTTSTTLPAVVSFAADVQPIFTANCAVPGCHTGAFPQQGLDLSPGHAYANLVGVPSGECPLFVRVHAGAPTSSYVMFKLEGPPQPCLVGNQMPSGGAPPLSTADRAVIAAWIAQGAAND